MAPPPARWALALLACLLCAASAPSDAQGAAEPLDVQLVCHLEIRGSGLLPFTAPKARVLAGALQRSALPAAWPGDVAAAALSSFTFLEPGSPSEQAPREGTELRVAVATSLRRADAEAQAVEEGAASGRLVQQLQAAGLGVSSVELVEPCYVQDGEAAQGSPGPGGSAAPAPAPSAG